VKFLFRCIASIFLIVPIQLCIEQTFSNPYLEVGLIISLIIGLSFVKFRFED